MPSFTASPRAGLRAAALGIACAAALVPASRATARALNPADTAAQMFQWRWTDLATECTRWLGPQGYGAVQVSPPAAARTGDAWWLAYQPVNYRSLSGRFGNQAQFKKMITACHKAGVRVYVDVVVNQLADASSASAGPATDGSSWDAGTLAYPAFSAADFHPACIIQPADYDSPAGRSHVQDCRLSNLPDLDSESPYVRGQIARYLGKLLALGADGFRIDAAKHQAPASIQAILDAVRAVHPKTGLGEPIWITQEVIPDGEAVRPDWFVNGTLNEFQFTYAMQQAWRDLGAFSPSTIPAMMGSGTSGGGSWGFLPSANATVFVNNWDTERDASSLVASNFSGSTPNDTQGTHRYELANVFMLAQAYGQAMVHSGFRFSNRDAGPPAASPYLDGNAQVNVDWDFIHRWPAISNMVKFRSAAAGQPQDNWVTGSPDQIAFSRGNVGFVALNNSLQPWSRSFSTGLPPGTYCNVVHGLKASATACAADSVTVDASGNASLTVPADGGPAVPAVAIYAGQKLKK